MYVYKTCIIFKKKYILQFKHVYKYKYHRLVGRGNLKTNFVIIQILFTATYLKVPWLLSQYLLN